MVECGGLENHCRRKVPGFESLSSATFFFIDHEIDNRYLTPYSFVHETDSYTKRDPPRRIEDFISHYPTMQSQKTGAFTFFHTTEQGFKPTILGTSGVGKVAAAMTTQKIIDLYDPHCILFTGLAGALNPAYEIGDLILADRCIQYDIDASELGFPAGTIPYTEYHTFTPDDALLKQAEQIETEQPLHTGTILTVINLHTTNALAIRRY